MEKKFETREMLPMYHRAKVGSIDIDKREFDVVFATDSEVDMWNWERGSFVEILDMKPSSVRLERLNSGAPLLDNHQTWGGTGGVLGKVIEGSAKVDGGRATARIKLSQRPDVDGVWRDIQDGILTTISVGYQVFRAVIEDSAKKLYRAIDWEPFEISLAPIPADINAKIREKEKTNTAEIEVENEDYQSDIDHVMIISERYKNF